MRQDGRLVRIVHVLIHMHLLGGRETSETIARMLNTNPVVVRRMMGRLRRHGIVTSVGGRGGGWSLGRSMAELTLLDVQRALDGDDALLPASRSDDHPTCPVERITNDAVATAYATAERTLRAAFADVSLAELADRASGMG